MVLVFALEPCHSDLTRISHIPHTGSLSWGFDVAVHVRYSLPGKHDKSG